MYKKQNIALFCFGLLALSLCSIVLAAQNKELSVNNGPEIVVYSAKQQALVSQNKLATEAPKGKTKKILVVITGYSSTVDQTDDTPFLTANGTYVRDGIIANNMLPFGTKLKIPELYGDKEFVVADRMNPRVGNYNIDIWFPSYEQAKSFGVKKTYIEVSQS